ncbi:MAG: hypothetical protein RR404_00240 [Bacilli bacterium]
MKKKYSLLITIMVAFLLVVVLSWVIPVGTFQSGSFVKGEIVSLGLGDLFKVPLWTFSTIFQFSLIFLVIGGFYGVLNKTGVYSDLLEKITKSFKKKNYVFLIITVVSLALISSLLGGSLYLFILVPFFISALLMLGYGKCTSLLATIGSIFIGIIGSTYAFDPNGYINYYLSLDLHKGIVYKIILLILSIALLIFFLLKIAKKEEKVESIPLYEENKKSNKSYVPLVIIVIAGVLIALVGTFSWNDMFGFKFFENSYKAIMNYEFMGYPLFKNILGSVSTIGNWSMQDVNVVILLMTLLIGWIYSIKFKDILNSFIKGAKEMLPTFIYATLANIVIVIIMNGSGSFINYTIINFLLGLGNGFNALAHGLAVFVDSFFVNYLPYLSSDVLQAAKIVYTDATVYPVIGLITQAVYGLSMYILPTSLILIAGLAYLNISYKEWFKYIWRYIIYLLVLISLVVIVSLMIV